MLGTINPIPIIAEVAHRNGAIVVVDGAQSVPHTVTDVKTLAPTSWLSQRTRCKGPPGSACCGLVVGFLEAMPPFLGGGGMILDVSLERFTPAEAPWRFEAGTPPIAEAVGLGAAVDYLSEIGMEQFVAHERQLTAYAIDALHERLGTDCTIFGRPLVGTVAESSHSPTGTSTPTSRSGARPIRGVRPTRPPLRQATDAPSRRQCHRSSVDRSLQR